VDGLLWGVALLIVGAAFLYFGGDQLVDGSVDLARALGMTPMVIGLTVVAFGTSAPELAATLVAAFRGNPEIAFGNVVGSNIANLGLILGTAALLQPLEADARFLWREVPVMLFAGLLMTVFMWNGAIGRLAGLFLLFLIVPYLGYLLLRDRRESARVRAEFLGEFGDEERPSTGWALTRVTLGIVLLVLGAHFLVEGAVGLARLLGVSERVIGLTVVAAGTSLPELASAIAAALKREGDILLGNVIGSNVFNTLVVFGSTALVRPVAVPAGGARADLLVMLGFSLLIWPFLRFDYRIRRWEGALLLLSYAGYIAWLAGHPS
jgi:cation:H+ antiporter